jgi:hypothetical protein
MRKPGVPIGWREFGNMARSGKLNWTSDELNAEAADALEYQAVDEGNRYLAVVA